MNTDHQQVNSEDFLTMAKGLIDEETDWVALMSNLSALVYNSFPDINWAGFYRLVDSQLVLGPFQGQIACTRIPLGKGVCGTSFKEQKVLRVSDVDAFPGHIACDATSKSEIVLPVQVAGKYIAVLDIDSPKKDRFTALDQEILENLIEEIAASSTLVI